MKSFILLVVLIFAFTFGFGYVAIKVNDETLAECVAKGGNLVVRTQYGLQCIKTELK